MKKLLPNEITLKRAIQKLAAYNTKMSDSINAAKIIQDALLPFETRIANSFADHFIFYQPKDIVSGDFYWLSKIDNALFVAVIDCTGHGVPGAFMSLLAYSLLNETVEVNKLTDPGNILDRLNDRVNYALGNTLHKSKGGMDMVLCKVEPSDNNQFKITFAGAKRPLYYSENGELKKQTGNRLSIGVIQRTEKSFTNHELTVNKGSIIYLSTDGFVDEPSLNRKKFGTPQFEKLLEQIQQEKMDQQAKMLAEALQNHRKTMAQRDDITVVGIKL